MSITCAIEAAGPGSADSLPVTQRDSDLNGGTGQGQGLPLMRLATGNPALAEVAYAKNLLFRCAACRAKIGEM